MKDFVEFLRGGIRLILLLCLSLLNACGGSTTENIAKGSIILPASYYEGKVSFTFDDGVESVFTYALPILAAHNVTATAYITTDWIGQPGYMNWQQVRSLQDQYLWEIGSHSVSHAELPIVTTYEYEITDSKKILQQQGLNVTTMATPYGAYDNRIVELMSWNYTAHRGFWDRDDLNTFPYDNTVLMVQSVERDTNLQTVIQLLNRAKQENKWLILVFHEILPNILPDYQYTTLPGDLQEIIKHAKTINLPVVKMNHTDGLARYNLLSKLPAQIALSSGAESDANNWWRNHNNIQIVNDLGRFPDTNAGISFEGTSSRLDLSTPTVTVDENYRYYFKVFCNLIGLTNGNMTIQVLEYDDQGNRLTDIPLGTVNRATIKEFSAQYQPSSPAVVRVAMFLSLSSGARGVASVSALQIYQAVR